MSEALDPVGASDLALYEALSAGLTGVNVYQDLPQDTPIGDGLVVIGDVDGSGKVGGKGDRDRDLTVTIIVMTEGEERAPAAAIVGRIEDLLSDAVLTVPGFTIRPCFLQSSVVEHEEGLGYLGFVQFRIFALRD